MQKRGLGPALGRIMRSERALVKRFVPPMGQVQRQCNSALRIAEAVCQRCAGSFASARSMMSQTGAGRCGARCRKGSGGCS